MEERFKKTLEECKKLELKVVEAEKEKKNVEKKYTQVCVYKCKQTPFPRSRKTLPLYFCLYSPTLSKDFILKIKR